MLAFLPCRLPLGRRLGLALLVLAGSLTLAACRHEPPAPPAAPPPAEAPAEAPAEPAAPDAAPPADAGSAALAQVLAESTRAATAFRADAYRDDLSTITAALDRLSDWSRQVEAAAPKARGEAAPALDAFRKAVAAAHARELPRLRAFYGPAADAAAARHGIDVRTLGEENEFIEFTSGEFISERNIKGFHDEMKPTLLRLRFRQGRYKWRPDSDRNQFYTLEVPPDSALMVWIGDTHRLVK